MLFGNGGPALEGAIVESADLLPAEALCLRDAQIG
jgi:hypothetical protein